MTVPGAIEPHTPPESVHSPPLTPPASLESKAKAEASLPVLRIVKLLQNIQLNRLIEVQPWHVLQLEPGDFDEVQQLLHEDHNLDAFVQDKVRYDYTPSAHRFVLRMPSKVHEAFNARVVQEIQSQLSTIARGSGPSADFARQIDHDGSERLTFSLPRTGEEEGVETVQHEPDAVFEHTDAQYPGVVIEVSYTQKKKDLARLADSYILGSEGNIRAVVGLDIEYKTSSREVSKRATISMWRPKYIVTDEAGMELLAEQTVTDLEFRDKAGAVNTSPQAGLRLQLSDFATEVIVEESVDLQGEIFISSQKLFDFLASSEAKAIKKKEGTGRAKALEASVRKRRRTETPPDQLDTDDEKHFENLERRVSEKADQGDRLYRPRTRKQSSEGML